jgi:hypothetical protein
VNRILETLSWLCGSLGVAALVVALLLAGPAGDLRAAIDDDPPGPCRNDCDPTGTFPNCNGHTGACIPTMVGVGCACLDGVVCDNRCMLVCGTTCFGG